MSRRLNRLAVALLVSLAVIPLVAATVSREGAEEFDQKVALIRRQADLATGAGARRTRLTQDELNSWLMYRGDALLPTGVGQAQISMTGDGRLAGKAVVDLDAVVKRRPTGGALDPFSFIGGKVPVSIMGILHTGDGMGRFEVQTAEMSGIPIPVAILQELMTSYSRTPVKPQGIRLDDAFPLPANVLQLEIAEGQAVVVQ